VSELINRETEAEAGRGGAAWAEEEAAWTEMAEDNNLATSLTLSTHTA